MQAFQELVLDPVLAGKLLAPEHHLEPDLGCRQACVLDKRLVVAHAAGYLAHHFAPDVDPIEAKVMFAVQQPLAASALGEVMGPPAWKNFPTWFAVSQNDEVIPPDAERLFAQRMGATVSELAAGHVGMVSHPEEVTQLIKSAAESVS